MSNEPFNNIIITCGISLFGRENVFGKITRDKRIFAFNDTNPSLIPNSGIEENEIKHWLSEMESDFWQVSSSPKKICAEYSMLNALKNENKLDPNFIVTLIHTDTLGGRASAKLLARLIPLSFGAQIVSIEIQELDVSNRNRTNKSIGSYMQKLAKTLEGKDRKTTCFAPIGGYKVMTAFGYITGSYMGFRTAYLHEDSQVLHMIPFIPVEIKQDFIEKNAELIREMYISDTCRLTDLSYYDRRALEEGSFLFEEYDGLIALNAFGVLRLDDHKED